MDKAESIHRTKERAIYHRLGQISLNVNLTPSQMPGQPVRFQTGV